MTYGRLRSFRAAAHDRSGDLGVGFYEAFPQLPRLFPAVSPQRSPMLAVTSLFCTILLWQGPGRQDVVKVRFDRLIVPVATPLEEQFVDEARFVESKPAVLSWIDELVHERASRRLRARKWLMQVDWRYARSLQNIAARSRAEKRRALRAIVQHLFDRRYNGEPAGSQVDEDRAPPRS